MENIKKDKIEQVLDIYTKLMNGYLKHWIQKQEIVTDIKRVFTNLWKQKTQRIFVYNLITTQKNYKNQKLKISIYFQKLAKRDREFYKIWYK